jgi:outer membrane protein assembly factor BamE (lipoprotein component of BamABCDE complex)
MKRLIVLLLCLWLGGCATAHKINAISLGMSKEDVIKTMGKPSSTSAI